MGVEVVSLVEQVIAPEFSIVEFNLPVVMSAVFQVLGPFSPLLIVLILYSWVGRLISNLLHKYETHRTLFGQFSFLSRFFDRLLASWDGNNIPLLKSPLAVLAIGMVSSCFLAFTPYRADINAAGTPVGTDTPVYILWVNQMLQRPIPSALAYAFSQASNGSRPLSLIFPYLVSGLFGVQADTAVKIYPLFLAPLLVVSSFLFVSLAHGDKHTAGLVGLMTAFSFQFTVGMWAGYYANWLALAESYVYLGIIVRFSKSESKTNFIGISCLSVALLFTHPWTWDLMLLLSVVFMIERSITSHDFRPMRWTTLLVAINVAADSIKSFALGGYGGGRAGADIATTNLGLSQLVMFWPDVAQTFVQYYSMLLADAATLGLAVIAIWRFSVDRQGFTRLVVFWVALASLPFPFLESVLQSRIIYLLPVPVLASGAMIGILRLGQGNAQKGLILLLILLFSANYAMSSMFQL